VYPALVGLESEKASVAISTARSPASSGGLAGSGSVVFSGKELTDIRAIATGEFGAIYGCKLRGTGDLSVKAIRFPANLTNGELLVLRERLAREMALTQSIATQVPDSPRCYGLVEW
jgi:hypothetical protein